MQDAKFRSERIQYLATVLLQCRLQEECYD